MNSILNPYINFQGNAREAMEFYKSVFGGTLNISTFKDMGSPHGPETENNVMHADLRTDNGIVLMASDGVGDAKSNSGTNCSISLSGDNTEELTGYYNKLSEGGTILQALSQAPWGDAFGMFTDKFGVIWLVNIAGKK